MPGNRSKAIHELHRRVVDRRADTFSRRKLRGAGAALWKLTGAILLRACSSLALVAGVGLPLLRVGPSAG